MYPENLYIGQGYDIHKLVNGRKLMIGGVEIPYCKGLLGHSDGDVLLHAICDSILGATAMGDLGQHFPQTEEFLGISSMTILSRAHQMITESRFRVVSIDSTIVIEKPRLESFTNKMKQNIASALHIPLDRTSVKAKTSNGVGRIGRELAAEAFSLAYLYR